MRKRDPQSIISQIETLLRELRFSIEAANNSLVAPVPKNPTGLMGDLYGLIDEGFFDQPKTLSEIHEKLRKEGINKPVTSLMKPLLQLIKKKMLKRERPEKGQFQYQQR